MIFAISSCVVAGRLDGSAFTRSSTAIRLRACLLLERSFAYTKVVLVAEVGKLDDRMARLNIYSTLLLLSDVDM